MPVASPTTQLAQPAELVTSYLPSDRTTALLLMVVHVSTLLRINITALEQRWTLALIASLAVVWCLATFAPRRYIPMRTPLIWALRFFQCTLYPFYLDLVRLMEPVAEGGAACTPQPPTQGWQGAASLSAASFLWASLRQLGAAAHATATFLVAVVWLEGSTVGAVGMQLPPLQHMAQALLSTLLLGWRATTGKRRHVNNRCSGTAVLRSLLGCVPMLADSREHK
jgi:hypothetical protein